jgi:23S rRNA (cytidine1920-2'-O)/16S rRNA (cytidine1409-2'-O)-methyltransferase
VDVGYGQFAWRLRQDPRVILVERQNIRYWDGKELQDPLDLAVIDVSFISLTLVLPKVMDLMERRGEIVALVKPQFEVGRGEVGKGGVVRSAEKQEAAIQKIKAAGEGLSLHFLGVAESPIQGPKGNREFFLHFRPA